MWVEFKHLVLQRRADASLRRVQRPQGEASPNFGTYCRCKPHLHFGQGVDAMTVGDLIDALRHTPRTRTVWITFAKEDERRATCITDDGREIHIIDTKEER